MPDGRPWPRITVVTPSFNQAEYLEETLRSVLLQGYPNLEYIVIDGGSTDGSVPIIERYAPRLTRWVSEPDRGQSHAVNKGFRQATGEILAWLNSDDIYFPGTLAWVAESMVRTGCEILVGAMDKVQVTDGISRFVKRSCSTRGRPLHEFPILADGRRADFHFIQPPMFWTRSLWERTGGLDERYHYVMDMEWCNRALARGARVSTSDRVVARFALHPGSKSQDHMSRMHREEALMYLRLAQAPDFRTLPCSLAALTPLGRMFAHRSASARRRGRRLRSFGYRVGARAVSGLRRASLVAYRAPGRVADRETSGYA